jgi:phosphodiesterase/alkaline phosphatase D-like protein
MKLPRRQFLHLAAGAAALPTVSRMALAQAYPSRPVRIVAGFAPGPISGAKADIPISKQGTSIGKIFRWKHRPAD